MTGTHNMQTLDLTRVPLSGVHLIEASAGTGKTYNITRLFVRALLEKKLTVRDILVVTFTEAATQELRGRIGEYLVQLNARWATQTAEDPFEQWLFARHDAATARLLLASASQDLDLAEIHTIHGFCSRVLKEQAFQSGEPFDQEVETDGDRLLIEAARDYYRLLTDDPDQYRYTRELWPTPEACVGALKAALSNTLVRLPEDGEAVMSPAELGRLVAQVRADIQGALQEDARRPKPTQDAEKFAQWLAAFEPLLERFVSDDGQADPELLRAIQDEAPFPSNPRSKHFKAATAEGAPFDQLKARVREMAQRSGKAAVREAVRWIRERVEWLRRQRNVMDFSAMIQRVHEAVAGEPDSMLARALATRYPVMLVDEFQDTDRAQFDIFYTLARVRDENSLFMIGDPKQAIYRFRGGDVHTYLRAREQADQAWTLGGNWRSTAQMVEAYNAIFSARDDVFGQVGIRYQPVTAAQSPDKLGKLIDPGQTDAAVVIPVLHENGADKDQDDDKELSADELKRLACAWCAQEARRLLQEAQIRGENETRPLRGRDMAFLVRSHGQAEMVMQALREAGLTAAAAKSRKRVFETPEATHLRFFLRGVLHAEQEQAFLTALATPWAGLNTQALFRLKEDPEAWQTWYERFVRWRELWQRGRVLAMLHEAFFGYYCLQDQSSHRSLTNLFHLAELMQQAALKHPAPEDQLAWLESALANPAAEPEGTELRLERDDDVITVMTMHGAKGLEFPVVFLPFANYTESNRTGSVAVIPGSDGLELGLIADPSVKERDTREAEEESMRLFYVALTRPIYRCYMPWLGQEKTTRGGSLPPPLAAALGGPDAFGQLKTLAEAHPSAIRVLEDAATLRPARSMTENESASTGADLTNETALVHRSFNGNIDRHWRVLSFTALARGLHDPEQQIRPERDDDDRAVTGPAQPLPLRFRMRPGAQTGEILHALLEHADFTRPDWPALADTWAQGAGLDPQDRDELTQWMDEVLDTPILLPEGPVRLRDLPAERTLREAEFFFPTHASVNRIQEALADWRDGQPVHLSLKTVEGMMRGFIDLIFEANGRYWVADYKSTWLGGRTDDYSAAAIAENMAAHHYDLQGLIYSVALHRLLRQRLPDYDPGRHLGGMVYLYLRCMAPETGTGVAVTCVPVEVLHRWDALFAGEAEA